MQERRVYPAKTILLKQGRIAQNYYFVEKGCLRVWFDNNGTGSGLAEGLAGDLVRTATALHERISVASPGHPAATIYYVAQGATAYCEACTPALYSFLPGY